MVLYLWDVRLGNRYVSVTAPKEKRDKENTEKKRLSDWRGEGRHRLTPRMKMTVDERPPVCHLLHLLLAAYLFSFRVLLAFLRQLSHTKLWRGKGTRFTSNTSYMHLLFTISQWPSASLLCPTVEVGSNEWCKVLLRVMMANGQHNHGKIEPGTAPWNKVGGFTVLTVSLT